MKYQRTIAPAAARPRGWMNRRKSIALGAIIALPALSACTPTISVNAGPYATEPVCAKVVLALPDQVLEQERAKTTSQATAAWGEGGAAITFTCGVQPPAPTTEDCQSITTDVFGTDETFDWITTQDSKGFTFVSYGRTPAMMVQVPAILGTNQPTAALLDV
ncbi:DUF3515 family protein, partial [Timonella senegalensis]|uniref:DUF3515 family protein n=1 Tax=Timonella senegalensis TaxID=1465825 RepID=UPI0028B05677